MNTERKDPNAEGKSLNAERLPVIYRGVTFKKETRETLAEASRQEAARLLKQSIMPRGADETIKACIIRAARRLGWPVSRTQDIWRLEAARIDAFEMDQLRKIIAPEPAAKEQS